jgi:ribonuclease BN (tRNA processing enzyme)
MKDIQKTLKVLGADGSLNESARPSAFRLSKNTVIDAGNIIEALGDQSREIENIFLTHAHFDHIRDIPFLIESTFSKRSTPLNIYAHPKTNLALKENIFNNSIWPEFHRIKQNSLSESSVLNFIDILPNIEYVVTGAKIIAFEANHTVPAYGFIIELSKGGHYILSGDTYRNDILLKTIQSNPQINTLIIETSFPNEYAALAKLTKHLTPSLVKEQLKGVQHSVELYSYHAKLDYKQQIEQEMTDTFDKVKNITYQGFLTTGQNILPR